MSEYIKHPMYDYKVLIPWRDEYDHVYGNVKKITLLTKDRVYYLLSLSTHGIHLDGDFAECGVYKGGSAYILAHQIASYGVHKNLHLFDTFNGIPASTVSDNNSHKEGRFNDVSYEKIAKTFDGFDFVRIYKGEVPDTLKKVRDIRFSFVHLDLNNYFPTYVAIDFFYERMRKGAIMLFDDYGFPIYKESIKRAVDESFGDKEEGPIVLPTGQSFIIKL